MAFEMSLSCEDLSVRRAGRPVVEGASFDLSPGDAVMLRGTNGSGKTSILRAIAGLARYDGGVRFFRGIQTLDPAYIRSHQVHLVATESGLSPRLTVEETARFQSGFYGAELGDGLSYLGLGTQRSSKVGDLSTGQRRRLSLLRLLINPRALWLLDEPFAGLDDEGTGLVKTLLTGHRARGGMVLIALHDAGDLPEARVLRVEAA